MTRTRIAKSPESPQPRYALRLGTSLVMLIYQAANRSPLVLENRCMLQNLLNQHSLHFLRVEQFANRIPDDLWRSARPKHWRSKKSESFDPIVSPCKPGSTPILRSSRQPPSPQSQICSESRIDVGQDATSTRAERFSSSSSSAPPPYPYSARRYTANATGQSRIAYIPRSIARGPITISLAHTSSPTQSTSSTVPPVFSITAKAGLTIAFAAADGDVSWNIHKRTVSQSMM